MEALLGNVSRSATRGVQDQVTQIEQRVNGQVLDENDEGAVQPRTYNDKHPKKRIVMLTAFLACLSVLVILANAFMSFIYNVVKEETFWRQLSEYMLARNMTKD